MKKEARENYLSQYDLKDDKNWYSSGQFFAYNEAGAYEFINENTVQSGSVQAYNKSQSNALYSVSINGTKVYMVWRSYYTYTYVKEGNKIYITNGDILTILDGKLYKDGESGAYIKITK